MKKMLKFKFRANINFYPSRRFENSGVRERNPDNQIQKRKCEREGGMLVCVSEKETDFALKNKNWVNWDEYASTENFSWSQNKNKQRGRWVRVAELIVVDTGI